MEVSKLVFFNLLQKQLIIDRAWERLTEIKIEFPPDFRIDTIDIVADVMGIPKDNTIEELPAFRPGKVPDDLYCRDWLYDLWFNDVVNGDMSIVTFMEKLEERERK